MAHSYDRRLRVADLIKHELAKLLKQHSHDPRFPFVTLSHVEIAKDYSIATVLVSVFDESQADTILTALNKAAGFFRHELAQKVNLRTTPKLIFRFDDTYLRSERILSLLKDKNENSDKE